MSAFVTKLNVVYDATCAVCVSSHSAQGCKIAAPAQNCLEPVQVIIAYQADVYCFRCTGNIFPVTNEYFLIFQPLTLIQCLSTIKQTKYSVRYLYWVFCAVWTDADRTDTDRQKVILVRNPGIAKMLNFIPTVFRTV